MPEINKWGTDLKLGKAECWECGLEYGIEGWVECVLPDDVWEIISPSYEKGCGLLCIGCIVARLEDAGLKNTPVKIYNQWIDVQETSTKFAQPTK